MDVAVTHVLKTTLAKANREQSSSTFYIKLCMVLLPFSQFSLPSHSMPSVCPLPFAARNNVCIGSSSHSEYTRCTSGLSENEEAHCLVL